MDSHTPPPSIQGRSSLGESEDPRILRQATVVVLVGVICALHIGKLPVAIPQLQARMGVGLVQAGFLLSMVQVAGMALGLFIGSLADRLGARAVMRAGLVGLALGSAVGAVSDGVVSLLCSRALEGLGFLMAVLPAPGLLRQTVARPATLSRALGFWGAYMPVGMALALLLGGPLMDLVGWRAVWWLLAGLSLGCAWVLGVCFPQRPVPDRMDDRPSWGMRVARTLRALPPWGLALAFLMYSGQWLAVLGFLPALYHEAGWSGWALGGLTALAAGINGVGNVVAGRFLARGVRPGVLMGLGYTAMGLGAWLAFAPGHSFGLAYAGVLVFSGLGGMVPATLFGIVVVLAPDEETVSTTVGWMQQGSSFGQFAGPPAAAALAGFMGHWHATWMICCACAVAGGLLTLGLQRAWMRRRRPARV